MISSSQFRWNTTGFFAVVTDPISNEKLAIDVKSDASFILKSESVISVRRQSNGSSILSSEVVVEFQKQMVSAVEYVVVDSWFKL